jgi:oligopeptide/dipeptide ABC transporter ATP-binding protein
MNTLEVKNLRVEFPSDINIRPAVDGVSFNARKNKVLAIVGESGSGKTVACLSSIGLVPGQGKITSGEVIFHEKNLLGLNSNQLADIRGEEITVIFQEPTASLNPVIKVGNQISEVLQVHKRISKEEATRITEELLKKVGISDSKLRIDNYPHQLSGGMNQRMMIAMAIACKPELIIADEPTTALDVTIQAQIIQLLKDLKESNNLSMILITHDFGIVAEMADDVVVMYAGIIVETGSVFDIFNSPAHPYTKGLLEAVPPLDKEIDELRIIHGSLPSPSEIYDGCIFAPRCDYRIEKCMSEKPSLETISAWHQFACFNPRIQK